ncbi:hypothetical protein LGM75_23020 [Burkholderia multivorans]|uniref:hypothetical protein n=1 Tax=Burkholderia multivorans TaxID=87883 RepID=UPI001C23300E|nr:hypothetical protein [Burkholderia multivorans]MBU9468150.1 hypothetical protein [Burkholderia multivorans]MCA8129227.1 hypothetical protein [Burkholderia multivorans]HEJ2441813.1 hypothetical protein [Burkholderia multivorans]
MSTGNKYLTQKNAATHGLIVEDKAEWDRYMRHLQKAFHRQGVRLAKPYRAWEGLHLSVPPKLVELVRGLVIDLGDCRREGRKFVTEWRRNVTDIGGTVAAMETAEARLSARIAQAIERDPL